MDDPITLRKGKHYCTHYFLTHYVSLDNISTIFYCFVRALTFISITKSYQEALNHTAWKKAKEEEMHALLNRGTWELVDFPRGKDVVHCL